MKLRTLHARTERAKARVARMPNVVGIGWGMKIVAHCVTQEPCITIFVRKKKPRQRLTPAQRVPVSLTASGKRYRTDVVELGVLRLEGFYLQNGDRRGTVGMYASRGQELMAVSCAHVVTGNDSMWTSSDIVDYHDGVWKPLGPTTGVQKDRGFGTQEEWGWFDGGIARIEDSRFLALVGQLAPAHPFNHITQADRIPGLVGRSVFAYRANGNRIDAVVAHVMTDGISGGFARHDLLIRHPEGIALTRLGDSGLVWRLADGHPLGMHVGGYRQVGGVSTISASFFVQRLARRFSLNLLDPLQGA